MEPRRLLIQSNSTPKRSRSNQPNSFWHRISWRIESTYVRRAPSVAKTGAEFWSIDAGPDTCCIRSAFRIQRLGARMRPLDSNDSSKCITNPSRRNHFHPNRDGRDATRLES